MDRNAFEVRTSSPDHRALKDAVLRTRTGNKPAQANLLASLTWVAFSCPEATENVYDAIAAMWLDNKCPTLDIESFQQAPLDSKFWEAYWLVLDGAEQGYDAASITEAVASLGAAVDSSLAEIAERHAKKHPGADKPHLKRVPGLTDINSLKNLPNGSLGKTLYNLLKDNGFDAEVLDRNTIMLGGLPPALQYLNTRILQMHDVWHLTAGYTTNAIDEVAISAFQLAQFGHNYSAMFLAIASHITQERNPGAFRLLMQVICEAWKHGRETPPLMAIDWESEMPLSIDRIREQHKIKPFVSRVPSDLVETFSQGTLAKKLKYGMGVIRLYRDLHRL